MNIRKIIAAAAALALCGTMLTACGGDKTPAETVTETVSETTTAATTAAQTDDAVEDEEEPLPEEDAGPVSDNPLQPLADAAMSVGSEWPMLWEVTDSQMISDFFLLDTSNANYKNMLVLQCPMSAVMTEIIIIEADDVSSAKTDLQARQKKAQDLDAFYPNDEELAANSIVGTEGSYAYFLLAPDAAEAEKALVDAIKAL